MTRGKKRSVAIEMLRPPNLLLTVTQWVEWQPSLDAMAWVRSQPGSSSTSCGVCAASGLCSVPTFNIGSSSNASPIFDTLALYFQSDSDNCLGPSLIPALWWLQSSIYSATRLDIVQVKLSLLKCVVNEFPCPKSQGEFLKVPVANVANKFNASLYLHEMCGTCVMCLYVVFNYGLRNILYWINDTIRITIRINVSTIHIVSYHWYDTQD